MMKCITRYHDLCKKVILESPPDQKIGWNHVYNQLKDQQYKISQLKFVVSIFAV